MNEQISAKRPTRAFKPQGAQILPVAQPPPQAGASMAGRKLAVGAPPQPPPPPPPPPAEMAGAGEETVQVEVSGLGSDGRTYRVVVPAIFPSGMRTLGARVVPRR